jgi:hypothetical protein
MSQSFQALIYLAYLSEIVLLLTATWNYNKINEITRPFYFFFYFVILQESFMYLMGMGFGYHNIWWGNIYQLVEAVFFAWFFSLWLFGQRALRWYLVLVISFAGYWIYSTLVISDIARSNSYARTVECLIIATGSAAVLLQLSRQTAIPIFRNPQFWIAAGAMLYFSFTVLVFVIYETIANNNYLLSLVPTRLGGSSYNEYFI